MASSVQHEVDLPLVDISLFQMELKRGSSNELHNDYSVSRVREACEEWGLFRLVNHGLQPEMLRNLESVCHELFFLPAETKERAAASYTESGYAKYPQNENFIFNGLPDSSSVHEVFDKIWPFPGENDAAATKCKETIREYGAAIADLSRTTSKLILASLGLDVDKFYHADFEKNTGNLFIKHYSSAGKMVMAEEGLPPHTDVCCFTILYQDNEGGLQILSKKGNWLNVKPIPNSFVVFIGDSLKAWTNGTFHSANHRVVYSGWKDRISLAHFIQFPNEKEICAPAEFVGDDKKRFYRPFTFSQLMEEFVKSWMTTEPKSMFLELFAGI